MTGLLGSSKTFVNGSLSFKNYMGGILSPNASVNWASTWNAVYVPYCDGTSFSSDLAKPLTGTADAPEPPLYYRGRANMQAVVKHLLAAQGMATATHVLIDGGSAGGLTTLLHADFFRSLLPSKATQFGAIGDAGWFRPDISLDTKGYSKQIATMWAVGNCSSSAACAAANKADPSACGFAPTVFPFLESNMFVLEGAYDSWQLGSILGERCASYGQTLAKCSAAQNASIQAYGTAMRRSIRAALSSTPHHSVHAGAFVSSCIIHVQSMDNENHGWDADANRYYDGSQWGKDAWNMNDEGKTPSQVVEAWFLGGGATDESERVYIESVPFPGNKNCVLYT
jgi:hypothetical protein